MGHYILTTNNVPRPVLEWHELTDDEREWLDYIDTEQRQQDARLFRYKGEVYDLDEFECSPTELVARGFDGIQTDSCWTGVAVRYFDGEGKYTPDTDGTIVVAHVSWA